MRRSSIGSQLGFTMIELLIAMAVTVVIVVGAVLMFTTSVQSSAKHTQIDASIAERERASVRRF